jgi:hypothetical protein
MADAPRFRRNPAIGFTVVDDETFLIEPRSQEVFYLDPVSSALWRLLENPCSAAELAELFAAAFPDRPAAEIYRDIAAATADLLARGLAVVVPEHESPG